MTISEQYALVASGAQLPEVLSDNLGGDKLSTNDLDQVRIPAGGGIAWEVPSLEGTELMKELSGVIVYWKTTRVY